MTYGYLKQVWVLFLIVLMLPLPGGCGWLQDFEQTNRFAQKFLASIPEKQRLEKRKHRYALVDMREIERHILKTSRKTGIRPEFISAVIWTESGFDSRALSHKGAMGLMQLMPDTCKDYGVADPFDPAANIDGGTRFLKNLLIEFKDVRTALAAYNFGPGNVRSKVRWPKETRDYVRKVISAYKEKGIMSKGQ